MQSLQQRSLILTSIAMMTMITLSYNNCGNKVDFAAESGKPVEGTNTLGVPIDDAIDIVMATCANGQRLTQDFSFSYTNPLNQSCNFGQGGNLPRRDGFFQGRIEQSRTFDLPAGSTLCDIDFSFARQNMRYDDHIILAYNKVVLASSFDFTGDLAKSAGMSIYNWSNIAGDDWFGRQDTHEKVYCLGGQEGLSTCSMPGHDQQGLVDLDYDSKIFQTVTALDPLRTQHEFLVVSIGDNDDNDCEIAPINFTVRVSYVK